MSCEEIAAKIKDDMKHVLKNNIQLEKNKADLTEFTILKNKVDKKIMEMENGYDSIKDRTDSLENWIDIYMPLRL